METEAEGEKETHKEKTHYIKHSLRGLIHEVCGRVSFIINVF